MTIKIINRLLLTAFAFVCFGISAQQASADTGITQAILDRAYSGNDAANNFSVPLNIDVDYLDATADCRESPTGATVFLRYAPGRIGEIIEYPDIACIGQGCHPTLNGNYGGGGGECVR